MGGLTAGLAIAPIAPRPGPTGALIAVALAASVALTITRPRGVIGTAGVLWVSCVVIAALAAGLAIGSARLAAIDAGALRGPVGAEVTVRGQIASFPRRAQGKVGVVVETPAGRLWVEAVQPVPELAVGGGLEASGTIRVPPAWQRGLYDRLGIARVLVASDLRALAHRRGGLAGVIDAIRRRSEAALERGTPEGAAALLRGFVLGQDDRIDDVTRDRFKRSGLAHLLGEVEQDRTAFDA